MYLKGLSIFDKDEVGQNGKDISRVNKMMEGITLCSGLSVENKENGSWKIFFFLSLVVHIDND